MESTADNSRESVIWLGAGFSRCATGGRAPLMRGFFAGIHTSKYPRLGRYLEGRFPEVEEANVESILQALDQLLDSPLSPRSQNAILGGLDPAGIKRELGEFCVSRLSFGKLDVEHWAVRFLAQASQ